MTDVLKSGASRADVHSVAARTRARGGHRNDDGFSLPELLIAMLVFGVLSAVIAGFMMIGLKTMGAGATRVEESKDAQVAAAYLDADVQSNVQLVATACAAATGETRLIGFSRSDASFVVYYASTTVGTVVRRTCGSGGSLGTSQTVIRNLGAADPTVVCDGSACTVNSSPNKVVMSVTTKAAFSFSLAGTRRTFTDVVVAAAPDYPRWGRTLTILASGADVMRLDSQARITVNGDVAINSSSSSWCKACTDTSFNVNDTDGVVQQPLTDPLIDLAYPTITASTPIFTATTASGDYQGPGVYRFPVELKGSVTMAAGVYIFEQGFKISGSGTGVDSDIGGSGVVLFNGCAIGSPSSCRNDGNILFNAGARVNLTAPTSGTYADIVIFQNRTNEAAVTLRAGGAAVNNLNGVVYLPAAKMTTINVEPGAFLRIAGLITSRLDAGSGDYVIGAYP